MPVQASLASWPHGESRLSLVFRSGFLLVGSAGLPILPSPSLSYCVRSHQSHGFQPASFSFPKIELSVIFICLIGSFFPIVLNTIIGVKQIDQTYFRAASCLGANDITIFRDVVVRGAMPSILIGLAVGMGINWMALVAAEMIAGEHGLGYMIWELYSLARYPRIVVGMIIIGLIGAGMSAVIRAIGRKLVPWQKSLIGY